MPGVSFLLNLMLLLDRLSSRLKLRLLVLSLTQERHQCLFVTSQRAEFQEIWHTLSEKKRENNMGHLTIRKHPSFFLAMLMYAAHIVHVTSNNNFHVITLRTESICRLFPSSTSGYWAASVCLFSFSSVTHHLLHFLHLLSGPWSWEKPWQINAGVSSPTFPSDSEPDCSCGTPWKDSTRVLIPLVERRACVCPYFHRQGIKHRVCIRATLIAILSRSKEWTCC